MRPAGEVRLALFSACQELVTPDRAPILREVAARACVGLDAARRTMNNMQRSGQIQSPRTRRVDFRNRPVAEYAPATVVSASGDDGYVDLGSVLRVWGV